MTITSAMTAPIDAPERTSYLVRSAALQKKFPVLQVVLLALTFVFGAVSLPGFASESSVKSILILAALVGLASVGQTVVVLVGGFDLSIAGFILGGALVVTQLAAKYELNFFVAVALLIPTALALGGLVGYLCHRFRIQPMIVTLATGSIVVGVVQVQTSGSIAGAAPRWLSGLTSPIGNTFGMPVPPILVIWVVMAVGMAIFLHRTAAGRRLYATGANRLAADYALLRTRRIWIAAFAFSALCSALAGVMLVAFSGNVDPSMGNPYLFQSLAAVIVGGTVFGGPGDYTRTMIGALLLTVLSTVLIGHGLTNADQQILYGVIILLAMAAYGRERRLRDRL